MAKWLDDLLNKKASQETNQEQEFQRKVKAHDWILNLPEPEEIEKQAAYEVGDTQAETIEKDYELAVGGLSNYNLAEMLAEYELRADNGAVPENFNEEKDKQLKYVNSNRKEAEGKLLKLLGEHTYVKGWKEKFEEFKKVSHEEPSEDALYHPEFKPGDQNWEKKVNYDAPTEKEAVDGMAGVGREEDSRTNMSAEGATTDLPSVSSGPTSPTSTKKEAGLVWKKAYRIGDKCYYRGHPAVIIDMGLNPFNHDAQVVVKVDGKTEVTLSGKELKQLGDEALTNTLEHKDKAPEKVEPKVEAPKPDPMSQIKEIVDSATTPATPAPTATPSAPSAPAVSAPAAPAMAVAASEEITQKASKADTIKKVAEIDSPWKVTKDATGQDEIVFVDPIPSNTVQSKEEEIELKK
jgi:hypothetical protein